MNKFLKLSALLLFAAPGVMVADSCNTNGNCRGDNEPSDIFNHTFFSIRPQFQSQDPEKIAFFRSDRMYQDCDGWGGAFQLAFFGGETRKGKDLTKWFFPCNKTELLVVEGDEDAATPFIVRDVDASQFRIATNDGNFQSRITMCPEQTVFGIGFDWLQMWTCKNDGSMGLWSEISLPVTRVRNKLNFRETVINNGGGVNEAVAGAQPNMTAAFRSDNLKFARIDGDNNENIFEEWGVAGVELKLGYNFIETDCSHVQAWVGVVAPAGNTPRGVRVFEPIVGFNGHTGLMLGGSYGYECWQTECGVWRVAADLVSKYFLENCETRTIEFCEKNWGRYMQVYANQDDAVAGVTTQAANIFTLPLDISPRFTFNYSTALIYENDNGFGFEVGYNFWVRQAERVRFKNNVPLNASFASAAVSDGVNPARTIAHQFDLEFPLTNFDNYNDFKIQLSDLDLNSVAHTGAVTNTIYGALNYDWDICDWQAWTNIGGEYEFCSNNAGLNRWTVFGKLGFAF